MRFVFYVILLGTFGITLGLLADLVPIHAETIDIKPVAMEVSENETGNSNQFKELVGTGFSLSYPSQWYVEKSSMTGPEIAESQDLYTISGDVLNEGLVIFGLNRLSLSELESVGIKENTTQANIDSNLNQIFPLMIEMISSGITQGRPADYEEPEFDRYTVDGHKVGSVVFNINYGNFTTKALAIGTIIGNRGIVLAYAALPAVFEEKLPIVEKMISSIKIEA